LRKVDIFLNQFNRFSDKKIVEYIGKIQGSGKAKKLDFIELHRERRSENFTKIL